LDEYRANRVRPGTLERFEQCFRFFAQRMMEQPTSPLPRLPHAAIED
jgi:hypothetical protein